MTLPPPQPPDTYPVNLDSNFSHFQTRQYTPQAITATNPITVTIISHGFQNGQVLRATQFITMPFALATGMQQLNNTLLYVQNVTTDTFQLYDRNGLPVDGTNFTPYISGGQFTLTGPDLPIVNPTNPPPPGVPPNPPV
jgi:hypothetical protein